MKFLFLSQGHTSDDQRSYAAALKRYKFEGRPLEVENIPFLGVLSEGGWNALWRTVEDRAKEFQPDVIFFQFFHGFDDRGVDPRPCLHALRGLRCKPLIFASLGDPYATAFPFRRLPNHALMTIAREGDAFFSTSMGELGDYLVAQGVGNVVFLPHAYDEANFACGRVDADYDIAMVGSCAVTLRPKMFPWTLRNSLRRRYVANLLWRRYGRRFGLFGNGWKGHPAWQGPIGFREQLKLFRSCQCVVDAPAPVAAEYYASDRPFYVVGAGVPLVMQYVKGFDRIFKDGESAFYFERLSDVTSACERALSLPEGVRSCNKSKTCDLIASRHTFDKRVDTIISVAEALRANDVSVVRPWHFDEPFEGMNPSQRGILNWRGLR